MFGGVDGPETLDFSTPISTLIRSGTAKTHDEVSRSQGAAWLTRGELDKEEYTRYLMIFWHVYATLERVLDRHALHPRLQQTYNPTLLARAPGLSADIATLLQVPEASWQNHPIYKELLSSPPPALTEYLSRIEYLANSADPSPLLAHSYVRYLADLSGGQSVRRQVAKAYNLDDDAGLAFYKFKQLGGTGWSTIGDMKKIKDWFREGMNAATGDDRAQKAILLEEANTAYRYNTALFAALRPPASKLAPADSSAVSPLGSVISNDDSSAEDEPKDSAEVVYEVSEQSSGSTYHLSSVIAFIAAISLSHFILVLGGFTGENGAGKLEAIRLWYHRLFAAPQ